MYNTFSNNVTNVKWIFVNAERYVSDLLVDRKVQPSSGSYLEMYHRRAVTMAQKGEVEELPLSMMWLPLLELDGGVDLLVENSYCC